jgi:AcrR family transcriptional regulator
VAGLRERKRHDARRVIQERALDLFDERGFAAVTIEEVAAAAEVSPSSVYRHFGTKEGLLLGDELTALGQDELEAAWDVADPVGSLLRLVGRFEQPADAGHRRVRYLVDEPSVRRALTAALDRAGQRVAPLLAGTGRLGGLQARVAAHALVFGCFAAVEQWHTDGRTGPLATYVEDGLAPLRPLWGDDPAEPAAQEPVVTRAAADPTYPEHERRIRRALGDLAVEVEPLDPDGASSQDGSPVVAVLVTVPDLDAEDDYLGPLRAVGYALHGREPDERVLRTPGHDVEVHVRAEDSPVPPLSALYP